MRNHVFWGILCLCDLISWTFEIEHLDKYICKTGYLNGLSLFGWSGWLWCISCVSTATGAGDWGDGELKLLYILCFGFVSFAVLCWVCLTFLYDIALYSFVLFIKNCICLKEKIWNISVKCKVVILSSLCLSGGAWGIYLVVLEEL